MKTIPLKFKLPVSTYWRGGRYQGKIIAAIILLIVAFIAPLTAAVLKTLPVVSSIHTNVASTGHLLSKPRIIISAGEKEANLHDYVPTKTEKLFSIVVGAFFL